jgi:hypothetical protein
MVIKVLTFLLFFNHLAHAQYSVAPFGSGSGSGSTTPPIGETESSACKFGNCSFELIIRPFCFGANLRSYPVQGQLNSRDNITFGLNFTSSSDATKKDTIRVTFPPSLTYNKKLVKRLCMFTPTATPPRKGDSREMDCGTVNASNVAVKYRLFNWLGSTNPLIGYNTAEFTAYSGIILKAQRITNSTDPMDINCFYRFTIDGKGGLLISDSVACYFPNSENDLKDKVLVRNAAGSNLSVTSVSAFPNDIRIILRDRLNSLPTMVPVVHGELRVGTPPLHSLSFSQGSRALYHNIKKNEFNKATGYQSYTLEVGLPGEAGFCGGFYSPLMFFFDNKRPSFTGINNFPLYGKNPESANYWPEKNAPGYFLVHLKKGEKNVLGHENLFGKNDQFQNGFEALKIHDSNADDIIDSKDPIFKELKLWGDKNADGISSPSELFSLKEKGVLAIELNYSVKGRENFDEKATAREKGSFTFLAGKKSKKGEVLDVWFNSLD